MLSNYRPVSNLPFLSKMLERVVLEQLKEHCTTHRLQDPYQSAYRVNHSTETALVKIFDDLLTTMDTQQVSILTLLDLSAAFDTVNHRILLQRLHHLYGIQGTENQWFESYLSHRKQSVKIGRSESNARTLGTGVPQGSGLGPWEYTAYTRELGALILALAILYHLFADDTQLQKSMNPNSIASQMHAKAAVETCLREISKWMNANKLKLNCDKTEVILIGTTQQLAKVTFNSLSVNGEDVPVKTTVKNLGVLIDTDLRMKSQVAAVVSACYRNLHMLRKMKHHLNKDSLHVLVQAFVISRLDYANALYYGIPEYLLLKLQRVQNMAARLICGIDYTDHITPTLMALHWLPIEQRIVYKICVLTFKCLHDTGPEYLRDILRWNTSTRTLRSTNNRTLHIPRSNNKYAGDRSFRVSAPRLWNTLPLYIREMQTLSEFKSKLKHHLFKQAYSIL